MVQPCQIINKEKFGEFQSRETMSFADARFFIRIADIIPFGIWFTPSCTVKVFTSSHKITNKQCISSQLENRPESGVRIRSIIKFIKFYSTIGIGSDITFRSFYNFLKKLLLIETELPSRKNTGQKLESFKVYYWNFSW